VGYQSAGQWKHYASWLYRNKVITKRVDATKAFTNAFLQPGVK
jgi:hypothetical protein